MERTVDWPLTLEACMLLSGIMKANPQEGFKVITISSPLGSVTEVHGFFNNRTSASRKPIWATAIAYVLGVSWKTISE